MTGMMTGPLLKVHWGFTTHSKRQRSWRQVLKKMVNKDLKLFNSFIPMIIRPKVNQLENNRTLITLMGPPYLGQGFTRLFFKINYTLRLDGGGWYGPYHCILQNFTSSSIYWGARHLTKIWFWSCSKGSNWVMLSVFIFFSRKYWGNFMYWKYTVHILRGPWTVLTFF